MKTKNLLLSMLFATTILFTAPMAAFAADAAAAGTDTESFRDILTVTTGGITYQSPYTSLIYNVPANVKALGVDVSYWQGKIDWAKVKAAGIDFALIRAGGRSSVDGSLSTDNYFVTNIKGAQAAGIKVGVYFFSQAVNAAEAEEEAQYVLNLVSGYNLDLPIFMDYEFRDGHTGRLADANLSKADGTKAVLAFCNYISSHGHIPMLYANSDMLKNYLNVKDIVANSDIWYANYSTTQYFTVSGYTYPVWQYDNTGSVDGINGSADCNFSFVSLDSLGMIFDDVIEGSWYFNAVRYAYERQLLNGMATTVFSPNTAMSRAMLVTVLYRLESCPTVSGSSGFTDLREDWYQDAVAWARQQNIINGVNETTFAPNTVLTREQLATILYRYSVSSGDDVSASASLSSFKDGGNVSNYAQTAMKWAVAKGYVTGFEDGTLQPQQGATRAQIAMVLQRFCTDHE